MLPRMWQACRLAIAASPLIPPQGLGQSTVARARLLHTSSARLAGDPALNTRDSVALERLELSMKGRFALVGFGFYLAGVAGLLFGWLFSKRLAMQEEKSQDLVSSKYKLESNIRTLKWDLTKEISSEKWQLQGNINKLYSELHQKLGEQRGQLQGNISAQKVQLTREDQELRRLIVDMTKRLQVLEIDHNEVKTQLSKGHIQT